MFPSIDAAVGMGTTPILALKEGRFVELKGVIGQISYLPPNPRCEVWFMKLKEAPGYMFQAYIPHSAVDVMGHLHAAQDTEVFFKGRKYGSTASEGGDTIVALSYAYVNGYEMSFIRWSAKILNK